MKPYLPITLIAAVVVIFVFLGGYFIAPVFQSSQQRLNEQIQEKVEQAAAMLGTYDPVDASIYRVVQAPSTQPSQPVEAEYSSHLQARSEVISKALSVAREAVNVKDESGEEGVGGAANPVATRLEAVLIYDQADVLRRQAQARRSDAEQALTEFNGNKQAWDQADARVRTLELGLTRSGVALARTEAAPAPEAPAAEPAAPQLAAPEPAAKPAKGLFSSLVGKAFGNTKPTAKPSPAKVEKPAAKPENKPAAAPAVAVAPTTAPEAAPLPAACVLDAAYGVNQRQTQTIAQRLADLQLCKHEVETRLQEAESKAGKLRPVIQELTTSSQAAKARAEEAQKKMLALEAAGVDASDPNSLKRFTAEYTAASNEYRKATRELAILTSGAADQPQLSEREKEVLSDPVIAVDPAVEKDQRGLTTLQADYQATQGLIETQKALLTQIDSQIERLGKTEAELKAQLARAQELRAGYAKNAAEKARQVVAANIEAAKLEKEALDLVESGGKSAAQRALRAAEGYIRAAKTIQQEHPDAQNQRLDMIGKQSYLIGHAKTAGADLEYIVALVQMQRSDMLQQHQRMLAALQQMGVNAKSILPEGFTPAEDSAWTDKADAAQAASDAAKAEAIKSGKAALEQYAGADNDLQRLWMLHANMGAVHYLLAGLSSGPEADKERAEARKEYDMATRDRRDRPEGREYQGIMDALSAASSSKAGK